MGEGSGGDIREKYKKINILIVKVKIEGKTSRKPYVFVVKNEQQKK